MVRDTRWVPVLSLFWAADLHDLCGGMVFGFFTILAGVVATVNGPYYASS